MRNKRKVEVEGKTEGRKRQVTSGEGKTESNKKEKR